MNKILFSLLLAALTFSNIVSQNIDSLKSELKKAKHDTTRCIILNEMIEAESDDSVWSTYNKLLYEITSGFLKTNKKTASNYLFFQHYHAYSLNNIGNILDQQGDNVKALEYFKKSLKCYREVGDMEQIAELINNIGSVYEEQGYIDKALNCYKSSLKIREIIGDKKGISLLLSNIGLVYYRQGNISMALEFLDKSLKIDEEIGNKEGLAATLNDISYMYNHQGDYTKALQSLMRSLKIQEEIGNKSHIATTLDNIGYVYFYLNDIKNAWEYFNRSLTIREEIDDKDGLANSLNNIGFIYYQKGDFSFSGSNEETLKSGMIKALDYFRKSLEIENELGNKPGAAVTLINIGDIYFKQKSYLLAKESAQESMNIAMQLGFPERIKSAARLLSLIHKATGNHKLALENHELYIQMRDSLNNIETQKATIKQQTQYEYDKKKALADKEHELQLKQQEEKSAAEKAKQNIIIASVSVVLLLVAVFSVFLYNRFKVTQRQKAIIEIKEKETHEQKILIEEKHKEITDSINYAERIQRSFLATQSHLDGNLNPSLRGGTTKQSAPEEIASHPKGVRNDDSNYFIFFQPKDVVSGDFYWSSTLLNGNFALATADSTGHGVPGAIMSLLNITSLEKAIETETSPDKILNLTRNIIIERLKKDGSAEGGKDGMDCSVCVYDFKNKKLFIAAAHNPVWIVRTSSAVISSGVEKDSELKNGLDSARPDIEVIEIKPDKMPVGKHDRQDVPFTLHEIDLQEGDVVYTLTDGFPDQFGGEKGKKYMSKNLRELLATNVHLSMNEQKELLQKTFSDWKGNLEQIDDVTIVGIKI